MVKKWLLLRLMRTTFRRSTVSTHSVYNRFLAWPLGPTYSDFETGEFCFEDSRIANNRGVCQKLSGRFIIVIIVSGLINRVPGRSLMVNGDYYWVLPRVRLLFQNLILITRRFRQLVRVVVLIVPPLFRVQILTWRRSQRCRWRYSILRLVVFVLRPSRR